MLHLHLSDDQGWRHRDRRAGRGWPRSAARAAVGGDPGGCYTQDDYRAIVAPRRRAATSPSCRRSTRPATSRPRSRPTRSWPATAAAEPYTGIEVGFSSLDAHAERHLPLPRRRVRRARGAHARRRTCTSAATRRTARRTRTTSRSWRACSRSWRRTASGVVGWEEIASVAAAPPAPSCSTGTPMGDRGHDLARAAVAQGARLVMSPGRPRLPRHEVRRGDAARPGVGRATSRCATATTGTRRRSSTAWGRRRSPASRRRCGPRRCGRMEDVETMLFPRLCAVAEVAWTPQQRRDWDGLPRPGRRAGAALGRGRRRVPPLAADRLGLGFLRWAGRYISRARSTPTGASASSAAPRTRGWTSSSAPRSPTTPPPTTPAWRSSAREERPFWKDHVGAGVNAIRTRTLIERADVVVVRFGDQYRQWNAAFDAGYAAALGKPLVTLHPEQHDHALKEVDRAALAVAREPEQVVDLLRYVIEGALAALTWDRPLRRLGARRGRRDRPGPDDPQGPGRRQPLRGRARLGRRALRALRR